MIECSSFHNQLKENGITFFCGVPDSLLKNYCAYISTHESRENHIIAANEGNAIALAAGYHLATGNTGLVYMQNSGQGNAANPLLSLVDSDVYHIPVLLLIGWRGEPGKKDEPQHVKQGKVTIPLCEAMGIPCSVLPENPEELKPVLSKAFSVINNEKRPFALIVKKGTFDSCSYKAEEKSGLELSREEALSKIIGLLPADHIIVSTTGMLSRELFEYRAAGKMGHSRDFLTVGSMGHASQIALGIALQKPDKNIFCFDGDGAALMHMGGLAVTGSAAPSNYKHILFNNGAHDSVGGQPTAGFNVNFPAAAKACGYKWAASAKTAEEIAALAEELTQAEGPALLEIQVKKGARADLGRPTTTPVENKEAFMKNLAGE